VAVDIAADEGPRCRVTSAPTVNRRDVVGWRCSVISGGSMNDDTYSDSEQNWTVSISVRERDGQTCATAQLRMGDYESVGVGLSRLSPAEHGFVGVGSELAVAQALSDLARRLTAGTT
jgi:hypothetical protein